MARWFRCDNCGNVYSVPDAEAGDDLCAICQKCGVSEGKTASDNAIKSIVEDRNVSYLLHFTRLQNLDGILEHGIYPHSRIEELPNDIVINDYGRWDFHPDSVSLSICFPNYLMFYKYRDASEDDWVVLVIHPSVLWESKCAFCKHNAADGRISCLPVEHIDDHNALTEMFKEREGKRTREQQKLKPCDPTDPQAEILTFDVVTPKKILGVVFRDKATKQAYAEIYPDLKMWPS
jgi:hypothetical protein